ncbi:MAG: D-tyrosyl-tRNA(Tyr) deacylase [Clostridiales bacterium]|nr:D-tyrosyl-tRNA(Tyr) deacylase [Clostridiales bacterium]
MKAVVQRVSSAKLSVGGEVVSAIEKGFVVYFGVQEGDGKEKAEFIAKKIAGLRVFEDENGKMNLGLKEVGGSVLFVSQFTLIADVLKGNRPSFSNAMRPDGANEIYLYCAQKLRENGIDVKLGVFGADMQIEQINQGPVTIIYEV